MKKTPAGVAKYGVFFILLAIFATLTTSCHAPKEIIREVPVEIHDTTTIIQKDTVRSIDTVIKETNTIVRETNEADSALLASLGIKLKDNERAILILKSELIQKIRELEKIKSDSTYQHNETPVPITETEIKEVEKSLSWWQKLAIGAGELFITLILLAAAGGIVYLVYRIRRR